MDLLKELSRTINFTYNLALSPDGQFGSYIYMRNTSGKRENRIMYSRNTLVFNLSSFFFLTILKLGERKNGPVLSVR